MASHHYIDRISLKAAYSRYGRNPSLSLSGGGLAPKLGPGQYLRERAPKIRVSLRVFPNVFL